MSARLSAKGRRNHRRRVREREKIRAAEKRLMPLVAAKLRSLDEQWAEYCRRQLGL